ncbi:MAG: acylphosphatase [Dehalococcoidia bacterium]|nr:MAG: acylphosphatase [Dehalococcoidia bacterium]
MSDLVSLHAVVYGLVQGVFFRAFVSRRARELALNGYVRNLPERMVEIQAEGERDKLEKLIISLQAGPPGARVEKVITVWSKYTGDYRDFSVRY